jgi:hypothetical protein
MGDLESKREFLRNLDEDEVWMLLKRKSNGTMVSHEYLAIKNV